MIREKDAAYYFLLKNGLGSNSKIGMRHAMKLLNNFVKEEGARIVLKIPVSLFSVDETEIELMKAGKLFILWDGEYLPVIKFAKNETAFVVGLNHRRILNREKYKHRLFTYR